VKINRIRIKRKNKKSSLESNLKQVQYGNALYNVHYEDDEGVTLKLFDSYVVPPEELEIPDTEHISAEINHKQSTSLNAFFIVAAIVMAGLLFLAIFSAVNSREPSSTTTPPRETTVTEEPDIEIKPRSELMVFFSLVGTWAFHLSGVVTFAGALMFGLGCINDDAEG
jgi:hypothetical protein